MSETAGLLLLASLVGSVDVAWYHLYRFRLHDQPQSRLEELTHLARYGLFLALLAVLLLVDDPGEVRGLVLGLFALDLAVTAVDVLSEPASRAPLGGLPPAEYLIHVLATFAFGAAAATFWWTSADGGAPLGALDTLRVQATAAMTAVLLAVEGALYARSCARRGCRIRSIAPAT